jgi:tetratricopeptide (TPR) repeat protein
MFERRGGRRSGFGLVVISAVWVSLVWVVAACGDGGEAAPATVTTVAAATEPVVPETLPAPAPAETVSEETTITENVTYSDAETVYRSGKYDDAMELFSAYVLRRPENPWGHYMLGISAWKAGELERAETALTRAVELSPKHVNSLVNLARVLLDRDRPEEALVQLESALEIDSASADTWRVMGNALSDLGRGDEAIESYRNALSHDAGDTWSMNNMGLALIRLGRYEEALPPLARATELSPQTAVFQNNLGVALERSGYPVEAALAFRAAVDAQPGYGKAEQSLARVEKVMVPASVPPLDLKALAGNFADEITRWQVAQVH